MAIRGVRVVPAMVLLAACMMVYTTEAAKIETFNAASCAGTPTFTFYQHGSTCKTFIDQGAVRISEVQSAYVKITIHNQRDCEQYSSVAQIYGGGCVVQGATKLRAVGIGILYTM